MAKRNDRKKQQTYRTNGSAGNRCSVAIPSGRVLLRMSKSLHLALKQEAAAEGLSLNQLVETKLAIGLGLLISARQGRSRPEIHVINCED